MIFSMRGGAIALTLVRLAGSDGVDRGAHVVELGGRHLSLVRQAKDAAFGSATVEAENTAPEQAVGADHMRELGERGLPMGQVAGGGESLWDGYYVGGVVSLNKTQ